VEHFDVSGLGATRQGARLKILMICNTDGALYVFRRPIIEAAVRRGDTVRTVSDESSYFERLRSLGATPLALSFSRHSVGLLDNFRLCISLWRLVREQAPDVVHSFTHKPAIYGTLAARLARVPVVCVTITGLGTLFMQTGLKAAFLRQALLLQYRAALPFARKVYFQNPDDLAYFTTRSIVRPDQAVLTGGSGIDLVKYPLPTPEEVAAARMTVERELGADLSSRLLVLFPARGVREKGFFEMYEAARQLQARQPGRFVFLHLGLVDEGSSSVISKQGIDAFARECGVHYLGFKDDIDRYMRASDVVALPSYREGTPRSLIEAAAFGKAVVTTDAPGCRETVLDGVTGYLCKVGDVESLRACIEKIDVPFLARVRGAARALCEEKYDARKLVELTLAAYATRKPQA
jgi:N,N'-diacetylbacillosaminyl-diphospho-undecaprenol alpha-1,3-N-acetylgalactosaminyltransferase